MHENPSSHISGFLSYNRREVIGRPQYPALPIVIFERSGDKPAKDTDSPTQPGTQLRANIDGHSVHTVTIDHERGKLITDENQEIDIPQPGVTSPVSSIAEVTVTSLPDGGVKKDLRLLYIREQK